MEVIYYHKNYDAYQQRDIVAWARANKLDYIIELHRNAASAAAYGYESLLKGTPDSTDLAIHNAMVSLGFYNRGIKQRTDLYNMNQISGICSYILLELGFITNSGDNTIFDNKLNEIGSKIFDAAEKTGVKRLGVICGHGQGDPGAVAFGRQEALDVRKINVAKAVVVPPTPKPIVDTKDPRRDPKNDYIPEPGVYIITSLVKNGFVLAGCNNGEACVWPFHSLYDQMWEWDGESLINYQHGKALTIGEAATAEKGLRNTAPAVIWPYITTDHQKVYMQKTKEGGVNIFWKHSNKALDVLVADYNATVAGTRVGQFPLHGGDNQIWRLTKVDLPMKYKKK